jgi:hypothetical protein
LGGGHEGVGQARHHCRRHQSLPFHECDPPIEELETCRAATMIH